MSPMRSPAGTHCDRLVSAVAPGTGYLQCLKGPQAVDTPQRTWGHASDCFHVNATSAR